MATSSLLSIYLAGLGDGEQGADGLVLPALDVLPGGVGGVVHGAQGPPDGRVALEPGAKGHLPDPLAALHAGDGLAVPKAVPDGTAGSVAVPASVCVWVISGPCIRRCRVAAQSHTPPTKLNTIAYQ